MVDEVTAKDLQHIWFYNASAIISDGYTSWYKKIQQFGKIYAPIPVLFAVKIINLQAYFGYRLWLGKQWSGRFSDTKEWNNLHRKLFDAKRETLFLLITLKYNFKLSVIVFIKNQYTIVLGEEIRPIDVPELDALTLLQLIMP